jgi:hypothetical protein
MFLCAIFYYEGHSILYAINSRGIKQTPAHASDSPFVSQNELPAPSGTQRLQTPREHLRRASFPHADDSYPRACSRTSVKPEKLNVHSGRSEF